jgi:hypothetical protein
MAKYLTADQLNILPEERKALIAFANATTLGRIVSLNGKAHYYDQGVADAPEVAEENHCGTAGCVAGFVFAHARVIQGKRSLRGQRSADEYIEAAFEHVENKGGELTPVAPLLDELYGESYSGWTLPDAQRVVGNMLRTGKVKWRR